MGGKPGGSWLAAKNLTAQCESLWCPAEAGHRGALAAPQVARGAEGSKTLSRIESSSGLCRAAIFPKAFAAR